MRTKTITLSQQMLTGMILGVLAAFVFSDSYMAWKDVIDAIGELFVNCISMIAMPLVVLSILSGLISINAKKSIVSIALKAIFIFVVMSVVGAAIAIMVASVVRPGEGVVIPYVPIENAFNKSQIVDWKRALIPSVVSIIPSNIVSALVKCQLQSIVFLSIFLGCFLRKVESSKREKTYNIVRFLNEIVNKMASFVMKFAPLATFALLMGYVGGQINAYNTLIENMVAFSYFVISVFIAIVLIGGVVLPLILGLFAKVSPWSHLRQTFTSLMVALTTCSSYCALPSLVYEARNKSGISDDVAGFVIPFGISFNKVGTIVFECIAVSFVMQSAGMEMSAARFLSVVGLSIATVFGVPSVPYTGVFALAVMLKTMGLPEHYIGAFLAIDALCDMPRTVLNSYSVSCAAVVVAKSEGEELTVF